MSNMLEASTRSAADVSTLIDLVGKDRFATRIAELRARIDVSTRYGRLLAQRQAAALSIEKARRGGDLTAPEIALHACVSGLTALDERLSKVGRVRFRAALDAALSGDSTLSPLLHLHRTAMLHEQAGFTVHYAGFEDAAQFDLLISRAGEDAEIVCDTVSAEEGRFVHQSAWVRLMDRIDPDLQTWLAAHPGRYLLKMTLPQGLREELGADDSESPTAILASLHQRINTMLSSARRSDYDEAAVLRLDPLMLAAAQADENGLMAQLRHEFGPEANLAVTGTGKTVFVMAARAVSENQVALAMRNRLAAIAPARLTGTRPGVIAIFLEDTNRREWRLLRDNMTLEGEARQFLTFPEAKSVVAISCTSNFELCEPAGEDSVIRFRSPSHPAGKSAALAPAVVSTN